MEKSTLRITIGGQRYTIVAGSRPEEAKILAADMDKRVTRLLRDNPSITYTQALVLTALDYADAAKTAAEREAKLRAEIRDYLEDSARAKTERDKANRELERLKAKLKKVQNEETSSGIWG